MVSPAVARIAGHKSLLAATIALLVGCVVFFHVAVYMTSLAASPPFETVCNGLWGQLSCTSRPPVLVTTLASAVATAALVWFLFRKGFVRTALAFLAGLVAAALFLALVVNPSPCPNDLNLGVTDEGGGQWECLGGIK